MPRRWSFSARADAYRMGHRRTALAVLLDEAAQAQCIMSEERTHARLAELQRAFATSMLHEEDDAVAAPSSTTDSRQPSGCASIATPAARP